MRQLFPTSIADLQLDSAYWVEDAGDQYVSAVMISSVDGAAEAQGRSGGLGNAADQQLFALLRAQAEVILVGAGTARIEGYGGDHPSPEMLDVRRRHRLEPAPRLAVLTNRADLDPGSALFTDTEVRPLVITSEAAPPDKVRALTDLADVIVAGAETVDLSTALDELRIRGLTRVSCEGGPSVLGQLIAVGRLNDLCLTLSPRVLAGGGRRITNGPDLDPAVTLDLVHILESDSYLFLKYRVSMSK